MKFKAPIILISLLAVLLLSGIALYIFKASTPDTKKLNSELEESMSELSAFNTNVNLFALRNRINLDSDYDELVKYTKSLDQSIKNIDANILGQHNFNDTLVQNRFNQLRESVINKLELIENFKTHNSVLRNSEKYAPIVGKRLLNTAQTQNLSDAVVIYRNTVISVMEYASQESENSSQELSALIALLPATESIMPDSALVDIIEFTSHANTVLFEKSLTDAYLTKAIDTSLEQSIDSFKQTLLQWSQRFDARNALIETLSIAYIVFLLVILTVVIFILRSLYSNLEKKVTQKTNEVERTFEELKKSEGQLMQAEKMSSLGQLVAGIAHEINTPLGYVSSNLSTVENNIKELKIIYDLASLLSKEVSSGNKNSKVISSYLKKIIITYRELHKGEIITETKELLQDSVTGIEEISQLVISLNEFSRIDEGNRSTVNIKNSLKSAIKINSTIVGSRKIIENYQDVPDIEFVPVQLNQVFLNVLTNAAQATDDQTGTIEIKTYHNDDFVTVEFIDNGEGMNENVRKHIFDPFFTTKDVNEGTGLGMSITYKVIKSHGGDIEIESELGKGSKITLILPIKRAQHD